MRVCYLILDAMGASSSSAISPSGSASKPGYLPLSLDTVYHLPFTKGKVITRMKIGAWENRSSCTSGKFCLSHSLLRRFLFFCDNFFTSTRLISIMTKKKTLVTGTARVNRIGKCPLEAVQNYKKKSQKSFSSKFNKKHRIFACRWKDNNVVTMLSNQFGAKPTKKAERYSRKQHKKVAVEQPNLIYQYNKFMGGVDLMDNHVANYRISMRGKKWYIPIFLWMMDSHVQCLGTIKGDRLEAGPTSVQALLVKYSTEPTRPGAQKRGGARKVPIPARKGEGHLVTSLLLRQRCLLCKSKTVKKCVKCGPLPDKCFLDFHSS